MDTESQAWMEYIAREVRAACEHLGWGHQLRRKWEVRERPVRQSDVDDLEWKLLPEYKLNHNDKLEF